MQSAYATWFGDIVNASQVSPRRFTVTVMPAGHSLSVCILLRIIASSSAALLIVLLMMAPPLIATIQAQPEDEGNRLILVALRWIQSGEPAGRLKISSRQL
jgi:hypothetical protein